MLRRLACSLLLFTAWALAEPPAGYYSAADGLTGLPLKQALHEIISNGHVVIPYEGLFTPIRTVWTDPENSANIRLIYSDASIPRNSSDWSREHLWPRSRGNSEHLGPDDSDLFHVVPCNSSVNTARSTRYFDNSDPQDPGFTDPAHPAAPSSTRDSDSWEPPAHQKGDIARALFYMAVRYDGAEPNTTDLELVDGGPTGPQMANLTTLLAWHAADPPDDFERSRNEAIFALQKNRNPFIDHPEWVAEIWGTGPNGKPIVQVTPGVPQVIESPSAPGTIILRMSPPPTIPTLVHFNVSGTAASTEFDVIGQNLTWDPQSAGGSVVFNPGVSTVTMSFTAHDDGIEEGLESIVVSAIPTAQYLVTGHPAQIAVSDGIPAAPPGVIASWHFNNPLSDAPPSYPSLIPANAGAGEIELHGWSSATGGPGTDGANDDFTGVTGAAISLIGNGGNGRHFDVRFSTVGWAGISLSLFTRGTNTGYDTAVWSWSVDGTTFTPIENFNSASRAAAFEQKSVSLADITELANAPQVILRCTLSGATGTTGNNRIDDLTISGIRYSQGWLAKYPPLSGADTAYDADPDGDGLPQLAEWALDLDPFSFDVPVITSTSAELPDPEDESLQRWPTVTFPRRIDAPHLAYIVEWSEDLANWQTDAVFVEAQPLQEGFAELATWRAPVPISGPDARKRVFFRLRLTSQ